ncbi:hypothetical protein BVG19_g2277 [[Candida] boidinii]|nr:hypothetical protein BVG19_g2277 [[Candida] boidinii]OWB52081.1 hypothetical protein B5S27_g3653 [[Candida] boidinii]
MRPLLSVRYLYILVLASFVSAFGSKDSLLFSCITVSRSLNFDYSVNLTSTSSAFWDPVCHYEPIIGTLTTCLYEHSTSKNSYEYLLSKYASGCNENSATDLTPNNLINSYKNASSYIIIDTPKDDAKIHNPVKLDLKSVDTVNNSFKAFFLNMSISTGYAVICIFFWVVTLGIIGVFNHLKSTFIIRLLTGSTINKLRGFFGVSAFITQHHLQHFNLFGYDIYLGLFNCLLPTNQESIILILYLCLVVAFSKFEYPLLSNNSLFATIDLQQLRYIADRTGLLAFAQLPPLFLFAGRNNLLITLTGVPFNSFIILHKWISRLMTILALVHAHFFALYFIAIHRIEEEFIRNYIIAGEVAILCCLVFMVQAMYWFRQNYYELFLFIHIICAIGFIVGCFIHCRDIGYMEWIYLSIAFWLLDRILRFHNIYQFGISNAQFTLRIGDSSDDKTFVISVPRSKLKGENWKTYPGCYIYIYVLSLKFKFWESHPFTIYDSKSANDGSHNIMIYVKPKSGTTYSIYNRLIENLNKTGTNSMNFKVAIEGPYGHKTHLENCDKVILLAGGNGITGPYYHSLYLLNALKKNNVSNGLNSTNFLKEINFIWIIRNLDTLRWFYPELKRLQELDTNNNIKKIIYITKNYFHDYNSTGSSSTLVTSTTPLLSPNSATELSSTTTTTTTKNYKSIEGNADLIHGASSNTKVIPLAREIMKEFENSFEFRKGRPDFEKLIKCTAVDEETPNCSTGIVSCGPNIMCDSIRNTIATLLMHDKEIGNNRIDLYEELQVW